MNEKEWADWQLEDDWILFVVTCTDVGGRTVNIIVEEDDMQTDDFVPITFDGRICISVNFKGFYSAMAHGLYQGFFGPHWNPKPKKLYDRKNK